MAKIDISKIKQLAARFTPKQRQYATLAAIITGGIGALWAVFAFTGDTTKIAPRSSAASTPPGAPTNVGVMAPGQQVNPLDQWVGTAGRKLAQYENERDEQTRINRDRKEFEGRTMQRFTELEQKLTASAKPAPEESKPQPVPALPVAPLPQLASPPNSDLPTNLPPPPGSSTSMAGIPAGTPAAHRESSVPELVRVAVSDGKTVKPPSPSAATDMNGGESEAVDTFLPVSFTHGVLLGGLDAPTGGQSQSNPHPVLIRLSDDSVLPNKFRGEYKECFVIAAGYGDIGSERAYLRTESLSCIRDDGSMLEAKIQGSVYGEDGKVGMRGRLVSKQGQMLANALLSGIASGIGQGLSTSSSNYSTSTLGTIANTSGSEATRAGLGNGVGRALDRLAQYYIKLAEQTFPVIEIDARREIDVVITKGVRISAPAAPTSLSASRSVAAHRSPAARGLKGINDEDY